MKRRSFIAKALAGIAAMPILSKLVNSQPEPIIHFDDPVPLPPVEKTRLVEWNPSMLPDCTAYFCGTCGIMCSGEAIPHYCAKTPVRTKRVDSQPYAYYDRALNPFEVEAVYNYFGRSNDIATTISSA